MNNSAFSQQVCLYRPSLMQSALRYTQNHDDADDLVQETMIKAIRYESKFEEGSNLLAWLFTIMKNTFINNYRSLCRKTAVITCNSDLPAYHISGSDVNRGEGKFIMEDLSKALTCLDPVFSVPFLRYFEGYKYQEIAEEIKVPIGTIKTRIHVARRILKSYLKMYR